LQIKNALALDFNRSF